MSTQSSRHAPAWFDQSFVTREPDDYNVGMDFAYLAAAIQMSSTTDKAANLALAEKLVQQAAARGAKLVVLPEFFNCLGRMADVVQQAEPLPGPTSEAMSQLARRHDVTLVAGSICEASDTHGKGYNTSLIFGPDGQELSRYRKIHLFDVDLPGQITYAESRSVIPGDMIQATETPLGVLGQATCYDLRFPELFRRLADCGMEVLVSPAAFSAPTGRDHWEILLRARAIENQVYIVAANQFGEHAAKLATWGHSMIIDPWGRVLAESDRGEPGVVVAEIEPARLAEVRRGLPALAHRREICNPGRDRGY